MIVIALVAAFVRTKHDQLGFLQFFSIFTHLGSVGNCNLNTPIYFVKVKSYRSQNKKIKDQNKNRDLNT
jgi:hypothetical protein